MPQEEKHLRGLMSVDFTGASVQSVMNQFDSVGTNRAAYESSWQAKSHLTAWQVAGTAIKLFETNTFTVVWTYCLRRTFFDFILWLSS
jgi:hypothetical protein